MNQFLSTPYMSAYYVPGLLCFDAFCRMANKILILLHFANIQFFIALPPYLCRCCPLRVFGTVYSDIALQPVLLYTMTPGEDASSWGSMDSVAGQQD